jgi:hypothetical protein
MAPRDLNQKVTSAIFRAEHLPPGSWQADAAYEEVSQIEVEIARRTRPDDLEGAIARRGAVTAALSARDWLRAARLAEVYLAETVPPELANELRTLAADALVQISTDLPEVKQVSFELVA